MDQYYTLAELNEFPRKKLQELAKSAGIKANLKNVEMIEQLHQHFESMRSAASENPAEQVIEDQQMEANESQAQERTDVDDEDKFEDACTGQEAEAMEEIPSVSESVPVVEEVKEPEAKEAKRMSLSFGFYPSLDLPEDMSVSAPTVEETLVVAPSCEINTQPAVEEAVKFFSATSSPIRPAAEPEVTPAEVASVESVMTAEVEVPVCEQAVEENSPASVIVEQESSEDEKEEEQEEKEKEQEEKSNAEETKEIDIKSLRMEIMKEERRKARLEQMKNRHKLRGIAVETGIDFETLNKISQGVPIPSKTPLSVPATASTIDSKVPASSSASSSDSTATFTIGVSSAPVPFDASGARFVKSHTKEFAKMETLSEYYARIRKPKAAAATSASKTPKSAQKQVPSSPAPVAASPSKPISLGRVSSVLYASSSPVVKVEHGSKSASKTAPSSSSSSSSSMSKCTPMKPSGPMSISKLGNTPRPDASVTQEKENTFARPAPKQKPIKPAVPTFSAPSSSVSSANTSTVPTPSECTKKALPVAPVPRPESTLFSPTKAFSAKSSALPVQQVKIPFLPSFTNALAAVEEKKQKETKKPEHRLSAKEMDRKKKMETDAKDRREKFLKKSATKSEERRMAARKLL